MNYGSLLFFSEDISYGVNYEELPYMIILGILGGFVGCMYTQINISLGAFRYRYKHLWYWRILEIALVSLLTSALRLLLPFLGSCKTYQEIKQECENNNETCYYPDIKDNLTAFSPLYGCEDSKYNDMAYLTFNPQGYVIKALFATPYEDASYEGTLYEVTSLLPY